MATGVEGSVCSCCVLGGGDVLLESTVSAVGLGVEVGTLVERGLVAGLVGLSEESCVIDCRKSLYVDAAAGALRGPLFPVKLSSWRIRSTIISLRGLRVIFLFSCD